jgi:N-acetyl-anhydromuramyl-L-alanine amidase AmpD
VWSLLALALLDPPWIDRLLEFSEERARLTLEYRRAHEGGESLDITPRVVVLHYTGGGSVKATWTYFNRTTIEAARAKLARAGRVNVSAHFLVDRDGTIYRLVPEIRFARHAVGLNHVAVGVENVGDGRRWPLTDAQVEANARLIRALAARYPLTHVLGHSEISDRTPYFKELDASYRNPKPDPGARFLRRVRARIADLGLAGP